MIAARIHMAEVRMNVRPRAISVQRPLMADVPCLPTEAAQLRHTAGVRRAGQVAAGITVVEAATRRRVVEVAAMRQAEAVTPAVVAGDMEDTAKDNCTG